MGIRQPCQAQSPRSFLNRREFLKSTAALVRAFANIADDLPQAGYSDAEITSIKKDLERYLKLREIIRRWLGG